MLVVDVEATCSEDGTVPRAEMEIIEIGALLVTCDTFEVLGEFNAFMKPVSHPVLTEFCVNLTGITQEQVDAADSFHVVLDRLVAALWTGRDATLASWGGYDKNQIAQDCRYHGVHYPFGDQHINIKKRFAEAVGRKPCGLGRALGGMGLEFIGNPHRGIDDARNIVRLLPYAFREGWRPG